MADAADLDALDVPSRISQRQEILAHADIKALVARFPDRQAQIRACIDGLIQEGPAETETLVLATKKAFDAIVGKLRVFLSYKRALHADLAKSLRQTLQGLGGAKVDVFLDEVKIQSGKDWFDSIKRGLKGANCLILLVPDDYGRARMADLRGGVLRRPDAARRAPDLPASPGCGHPAPASGISGRPC